MSADLLRETPSQVIPVRQLHLTVNGSERVTEIEDRQLLVDVLRENLGLTGPKIGCYNGDCGACTVELRGNVVKSCLVLAASAEGAPVTTIEGYSCSGKLNDIQLAFWENDAFQCGFCISGHLFAIRDLLEAEPAPTEEQIRNSLIGNLCRCTGYNNLVKAVGQVVERRGAT